MSWGQMLDNYTKAVASIPCPRKSCGKGVGERCRTSAVVHNERRRAAIDQSLWDPDKAQVDDPNAPYYAGGAPLEAMKPYW